MHLLRRAAIDVFPRWAAQQHQNPGIRGGTCAYVEQLKYVNKRIIEVVDSIVAQSAVPPVIIVQGDHGTFFTVPAKATDESLDRFAMVYTAES